jgi:hypothetical protein
MRLVHCIAMSIVKSNMKIISIYVESLARATVLPSPNVSYFRQWHSPIHYFDYNLYLLCCYNYGSMFHDEIGNTNFKWIT